MFEQLDDPRPPAFGDGFRQAVVRRARQRRRHRRLAGGAGVAMASLVVGAGGLYGRALWRSNEIERVDVAGTAPVASGDPVTVLVLGTDGHEPDGTGPRADTILLARIDPGAGTAAILSLPRDLMVESPGGDGPLMINAVAAQGLDDLVTVIEAQVGIPVDHVVEVGLDGFRSLVDRIGGIDVWVDAPVRDARSGLYLTDLGCVTLDGEEVLALVRSRMVEVLDESGTWVRDPLSDLRRVDTQRRVMIAALAALSDDSVDPVTLNGHVDWAVDHVAIDSGLGVEDLVGLAQAAAALDPAAVSQQTLPVVPYPDDVNRLAADPERAQAVVDAFTSGQPLPSPGAGAPGGAASQLPGGPVVEPC